MFNPIIDIDRRIEDLQRLKNNYQNMPFQQPINVYNNVNTQNSLFEARFLDENEKVDEILVKNKTAFIDRLNGKLTIKEINGNIEEFELIVPKTEQELKIEELEKKVKEYEQLYATNNEKYGPNNDDNEPNEPTTKNVGRTILKKSQ